MDVLSQLVGSGVALGMIYAVIAFGYQLTFATSRTLNFGQGEALMLGALVGLSLVGYWHMNYWLMLPLVMLFGAFQGIVVERFAVRPALKIKSEFGWIMSTSRSVSFSKIWPRIFGATTSCRFRRLCRNIPSAFLASACCRCK